MVGPAAQRECVVHLQAQVGLSERRACSIVAADRKMIRYPRAGRRTPSCGCDCAISPTSVGALATPRPAGDCIAITVRRRLFVLLRQDDEPSGINRIHRLYREEGLSVRKRRARRRAVGARAPIAVEARQNARWLLDFVHDQFASGRRFRILNVVDDVTRECLAAIPYTTISGRRVARELLVLARRDSSRLRRSGSSADRDGDSPIDDACARAARRRSKPPFLGQRLAANRRRPRTRRQPRFTFASGWSLG